MQKYAKLINNILELPPVNKGFIINYCFNEPALIADGYKKFYEVERPKTNRQFHIEYAEAESEISEILVYDETQEEADLRELTDAKSLKLEDATQGAKRAIEEGYILIKDAQIETDVETLNNLNNKRQLCILRGDKETQWLSKDDKVITLAIDTENPLENDDFVKIGLEVENFKNSIWNIKYIYYVGLINQASTREEVEQINIDYTINI